MINKSTNKREIKAHEIDADKFWSGVNKLGEDDCWEWQRARNTGGYGLFSVKTTEEEYERTGRIRTQRLAHRIAASLDRVVLPHDYIMHTCDNRPCCNPKHLKVGTARENWLDMYNKGRWHVYAGPKI